MPVDQGMRAEVYEGLKVAHGERVANAIMEMLPPAGVPELATKSDLGVLKADFTVLRAEFAGLRADLAAFEARFGERLERAMREQANRFIGWLFAAAGLSLGIAGAFARLG